MSETRISFGALAAERELQNLASVFVPTGSYESVRSSNRKVILLGNRGAGKTAILAMLAETAKRAGHAVIQLTPEDYSYEILSASMEREHSGAWAKHGAYAAAWKRVIYLLAMKHVVMNKAGLKAGAEKRIYNFVRDNYSQSDLNPIGALISYMKRLEGIKLGKLEASVKARELQRLYSLEEVNNLLDDLEEVCRGNPVIVSIDELDRGWDASEDAVAFVAGLFQAGTSIAIRTPHIRVVMSLRRELYESIPTLYEDAQKVRDTIETIDWTAEQLQAVICRRIRASLPSLAKKSDQEAWRAVMPPSVWGRPSFNALLDFTLWRPREVIHLCSQIADLSPVGELPFPKQAIDQAITLYARDRFTDVVAEYRFQYPGLDSVLETFRGQPIAITREQLELHCLRLSIGDLHVAHEANWAVGKDADDLIYILWRVGFLRAEVPAQNASGNTYLGYHELRTVNIRNAIRFRIHDMFATYLGCGISA